MRLKELRERCGMTQKDLAAMVGVSRKTISAYERGRATPSLRVALRLAQVLGVGLEELLKEGDNERTSVGEHSHRNGEVEQ